MRILVYGAGVLGCELAHVLMQNKKNVVTLLARGEWKEMIDQKGLVIRHWVQRKTTTERIKTVDTLAPDDYYDLVFVVVQAGQLPDVLPVLKANKSQYFVFVGNNPQAKQVLEFMQRPADKIAFGFQGTAGRREHDHVVSVYASAGMTVGGATTPLSGTFRTRLKTAFDGAWMNGSSATLHSFCRRAMCAMPATAICTGPPSSSAAPFWMPPMKPA